MNSELSKLIGSTISIHGTKHLVAGIGIGRILLLQYDEKDEPIQYIVGMRPYFSNGTLVWEQGYYFPFFCYTDNDRPDYCPMAEALRDASSVLAGDIVYVCMEDDDSCGIRCVGVFTKRDAAVSLLERDINNDRTAQAYAEELGKEHLTYREYSEIAGRDGLDNCYWYEPIRMNVAED